MPLVIFPSSKKFKSGSQNSLLAKYLSSNPPFKERGDWKNYRCIFCDDSDFHMGVNTVSGAVKCWRCGFVGGIGGQRETQIPKAPQIEYNEHSNHFSWEPQHAIDIKVMAYAESRHMGESGPESGWAYGRGQWRGHIVFPCFDTLGRLTYAQCKDVISTDRPRYVSMFGEPRLDCSGRNRCSTSLVLVEGPIDAVTVRLALPMWVASNFGTSFKKTVANDIASIKGLTTIFVWFDNEPTAQIEAERMVALLPAYTSVPIKHIPWGIGCKHKDQNEAGEDAVKATYLQFLGRA